MLKNDETGSKTLKYAQTRSKTLKQAQTQSNTLNHTQTHTYKHIFIYKLYSYDAIAQSRQFKKCYHSISSKHILIRVIYCPNKLRLKWLSFQAFRASTKI